MLHYPLSHWLVFLAAAFVLNLSPGPDIAFILGHTVRSGKQGGAAAMFGIWVGACCHIIFAVVGLSAIIAGSAHAFLIVKSIGVAYLGWLGVQSFRSKGRFHITDSSPRVSARRIFTQGVLIDLLNPKVAIFFLAFLPQFVVAGAGPIWLQLLAHGLLIIIVAAIVEPPLVLLGERITRKIRSSNRIGLWLDRALGTLFIGLAVKLAATER
jgi:threonine/homoserine/homoserine lactone efflux protein